jgi:hypothetical protein
VDKRGTTEHSGWPWVMKGQSMFMVGEKEAELIRNTFLERGEWPAVVELKRLFPGVESNDEAVRCVRTIASWLPTANRKAGRDVS